MPAASLAPPAFMALAIRTLVCEDLGQFLRLERLLEVSDARLRVRQCLRCIRAGNDEHVDIPSFG